MTLKLLSGVGDVKVELFQLADNVEDAGIDDVELVHERTIDRRFRPNSQQMQALELREAGQPLAFMSKMKRHGVEFRATMGPLKLFEPSNDTFGTRALATTRSIGGDSIGQIQIRIF